jgi:hypothetical protein
MLEDEMKDAILRIMEGAYDIHLHAGPALVERRMSLYEVAICAREMKMKGLVVKDHNFQTAQLAKLVQECVPGINICGGITLSKAVGGINPHAVEVCFRLGGKVVWMFNLESEWMYEKLRSPDCPSTANYKSLGANPEDEGYTVLDGEGKLKPEVQEIINLCKHHDCVFESSHLSPKETYSCLKEAKKQDMHKFVITHANEHVTFFSVEQQKELAEMGVKIMYTMAPYFAKNNEPGKDIGELGRLIKEVGPHHIVLGTDCGHKLLPPVVESMRMMVTHLLDQGVSEKDIEQIVKINAEEIYF